RRGGPRAGGGVGRRDARDGPRVCRGRPRLHRGGRDHALGPRRGHLVRAGRRGSAARRRRLRRASLAMRGELETAGAAATAALADRLRSHLEGLGRPWTAPIVHRQTVGSTNAVLKDLAREDAPEWTVVVADRQTAGRGRGEHAWDSPPGNLYVSVLVRPSFARVTLLPLAAGLAVAEAVAER